MAKFMQIAAYLLLAMLFWVGLASSLSPSAGSESSSEAAPETSAAAAPSTASDVKPSLCPSACSCDPLEGQVGVYVNCTARDLVTIPEDIPENAAEVHLDQNMFKQLKAFPALNLPSLKKLVLSHCHIKYIEPSAFQNTQLPKLKMLDLSNNNLFEVPQGLPKSISSLLLGYNEIRELNGTKLSYLSNINELFLDNNLLKSVSNNSFHHSHEHGVDKKEHSKVLPYLKKLGLNGNKITFLDANAFDNLTMLIALTLADNKLVVLNSSMFNGLVDLEYLALSRNMLSDIEEETFRMLTSLRHLYLNNNMLSYVPHGLPMLEWLDLSNNRISNLTEDYKVDLYPTEVFNLAHNPLHCNCKLLWLKELWDRREYLKKHVDLDPNDFVPMCASPLKLAGEPWDLLGDDMFVCGKDDTDNDATDDPSQTPGAKAHFHPAQLQVKIGMVTDCKLEITWNLKGHVTFTTVILQYYVFGLREVTSRYIEIAATHRIYTLRHLRPDTNYIACVVPKLKPTDPDRHDDTVKPMSLDHCIEVATKERPPVQMLSAFSLVSYYTVGMLATIIMVLSVIGGVAILYGLWHGKGTDWSSKYVEIDEPIWDNLGPDSEHSMNQKASAPNNTKGETSRHGKESDDTREDDAFNDRILNNLKQRHVNQMKTAGDNNQKSSESNHSDLKARKTALNAVDSENNISDSQDKNGTVNNKDIRASDVKDQVTTHIIRTDGKDSDTAIIESVVAGKEAQVTGPNGVNMVNLSTPDLDSDASTGSEPEFVNITSCLDITDSMDSNLDTIPANTALHTTDSIGADDELMEMDDNLTVNKTCHARSRKLPADNTANAEGSVVEEVSSELVNSSKEHRE